jgi:type I restriction enzyme S subunit
MKKYAEYKDSGIEWIGDIPKHWNLIRLKYLCKSKLMYGANESADFEDPSQPRYIRITDFGDDGKLKDDTFKSLPYEKAESYLLEDGDVLFARSGATVGKTFQFKNYNGLACFAGYLIKASPNEEMMLSDFIYFYTKSRVYENWKNSIFNQATIQNIGADKYNDLLISLPSIQEQRSIATYLNDKTSQIDTLIEKKQQMIELLKEERAAIINQAVTKGINPDA